MAGWQDAVANLQAQINTINSQISSLSGQEAANSSAISSLQTQVSALQTQLVSLQSQVVLADVVGMATLGNFAADSSQKTVQLTAGGNAVLQVPVQDGKSFRVKVTGHSHNPSPGVNTHVLLYINGSQTNVTLAQGGSGSQADNPFHIDVAVFWDSVSNQLIVYGTTTQRVNGGTVINSVNDAVSISSPANFPFQINGFVDSSNPSATVTVTEFRAYAD